jgi:hypothetical protein
MPTPHLNWDQRLELSKSLFNFGNIIGGTVIVNQAIFGMLTPGTFIFGALCFTLCFVSATLLLNKERI